MIAPYKWLSDYVDMDITPEELMQKLIMTGSEVDGVKELGSALNEVVVGKIESIEKHPDADKLSVCLVDVGEEPLQIVCGANNIFTGALVPVALTGACLPGDFKIKKGKIRGVYSYGMLCSGEELNLSDTDYPGAEVDGIMILHETYEPGTSLREVLGLTDTVLEIEIGANRPDCLSMQGIARECAAALQKDIKEPDSAYQSSDGDICDYLSVEIAGSDLCERYVARAVKNVVIKPSPKWLRDRLVSAGVRSINNIVDITNFVMLETGQPMHAFDYNDIRGKKIIVRRAKNGESITTLDDKERKLTDEMLLICDGQGPIGIAGIMGGFNSEIKDNTSTVIFESAKFLQGNVRRTSRGLGLPTESAMRFSKGVDTAGCKKAMDRALNLIDLLEAGDIVGGEIDILSADISPRQVKVDAGQINGILGTDISAADMADLLRRVFIKTQISGNTLTCDIPSFRNDISLGEDIAEEVARMFGYDNIPTVKMTGEVKRGIVPEEERSIDKIKSLLVGQGCYECVTYSFSSNTELDKLMLSPDDELRRAVKILNPLGDEQGLLRTSPVPDILKVVANNLNQKVMQVRLFESGRVYHPTSAKNELPKEKKYICIAVCGEEDFFSLKGITENIFEAFGIKKVKFSNEAAVYYHPGRKSSVYAGKEKLGELGEIHPDVALAFGINKRVYVAELCLKAICEASDDTMRYETLPKFPAAQRDIALVVDKDVSSASLLECIEQNAGPFFESASLFDVYTGDQAGEGSKSLAYSIVFRAKDRTLLDEEANAQRDIIVKAAADKFGAKMRE